MDTPARHASRTVKLVPKPLTICLAVAFVLVVACAPFEARGDAVQDRIEAFLVSVRDRVDGLGWDQLRSDVRDSYPGGRSAWVQGSEGVNTGALTWRILSVSIDDFVGCAEVDFGSSRGSVPSAWFDEQLPGSARVAALIAEGRFTICATVGPLPVDAGVHGVG